MYVNPSGLSLGMHPTLVLLVVGLTPRLIGPNTPNLARLAREGALTPDRVADAIWDAVATDDADWRSEVPYSG